MMVLWGVLLTAFAAPLQAEPATARYAPVQLQAARDALEQAKRMLRLGRGEAARRLATQAATDARLAWGMTDSAHLRSRAAAIYAQSALIDRNALSLSMKDTKEEP